MKDLIPLILIQESDDQLVQAPLPDQLIGIDILEFADSLPRLYYVDILSPISDRNKINDLISTHSFNPKKNS